MAAEQFSSPVRGSSGTPISTTAAGSMQTDNYEAGAGFEFDGSNYPYEITAGSVNAIQEVILSQVGDVDMVIDTVQGDTISLRLDGAYGRYQTWEMETVTFYDPRATGAALYGAWGGE